MKSSSVSGFSFMSRDNCIVGSPDANSNREVAGVDSRVADLLITNADIKVGASSNMFAIDARVSLIADLAVGASSNVVSRAYDRATVMSDSPISHRREFEWLHDPNQANTHRRFVGANSSYVCNRVARNVSPSIGASSNENLTTLTVSM